MTATQAVEGARDVVDVLSATGAITVAGGILIALLTFGLGALSSRRRERRDRYAAMTETLAAWAELPYRIRRRTSNSPEVIEALTARMSDLQEQFVRDHAYLAGECKWLADERLRIQCEVQATTAPFIKEAWETPPPATTAGLNLNGWGPPQPRALIGDFSRQLRWRFGPLRVLKRLHLIASR